MAKTDPIEWQCHYSADSLRHTRFLSPAEQTEADIWLNKKQIPHVFFGGYAEAERQVCFLVPEYQADCGPTAAEKAEALAALRLQAPARAAPPSHRDYLGSLLGLGIRRDQLGDILVDGNEATVLVLASMADYIAGQLERIGSLPVKITSISLADIKAAERTFSSIRITVASLRLDKILAAGFGLPRTEAADLIRSGSVQLNWREELRPDQNVPVGAVISLRGSGRIRLAGEEGLSRKDRHILMIEKYQ